MVERSAAALEELGYATTSTRLALRSIGVPQTRVRHVMVATRDRPLQWTLRSRADRSVAWAIGDLLEEPGRVPQRPFDSPSRPSDENRRRMAWLFEHDAHNLPNSERPACHRTEHSYRSMYGRLWWEAPAQTITSGFGSMGQGRYVHPLRHRTLTPHEAARLQFLPDFMAFDAMKTTRSGLATMIGNAAPPMLTISVVDALLQQGFL